MKIDGNARLLASRLYSVLTTFLILTRWPLSNEVRRCSHAVMVVIFFLLPLFFKFYADGPNVTRPWHFLS